MNSAGSSCGELVKLGLFDLGQRHLVRDCAALRPWKVLWDTSPLNEMVPMYLLMSAFTWRRGQALPQAGAVGFLRSIEYQRRE
jgi:hypothetical protein